MDIPIQNMPKFRVPESSIVHCTLPHETFAESGSDIAEKLLSLDVKHDVKVSLTFSSKKLMIPSITLFDAKERISMQQLKIIFSHDKYDVLSVRHFTIYGPRINRLDPTHPSLTAFDIVYQWESVQEDDFPFAVHVMFVLSLCAIAVVLTMVCRSHPSKLGPNSKVAQKRPQK